MVLRQNNNELLPLTSYQTAAVIGPLADDKASQVGAWAGNGQARDAAGPLGGRVATLGDGYVLYAKGGDIPPFEKGLAAGVASPAPTSATGAAGVATSNKPASIEDAVSP